MFCLIGFAALLGPRLAVAIWWLFGDKVEAAFDGWVWPLLGIIFAPWTTLAFVIAWQPSGLSGDWDAILIIVGVALDIVTHMHRFAAKAVRPAPRY